MNINPLVSVIVPVYHVENYIRECVNSILAQTYKDLEIILVDDGGDDACPGILDEYAREDDRVYVIHKANGGLVSARKAGLHASSGEFIAYVDGDDWIEPTFIERLLDKALEEDADVVAAGFLRGDEGEAVVNQVGSGVYTGRQDSVHTLEFLRSYMLYNGSYYEPGVIAAIWNKLYRREVLTLFQNRVFDSIVMGEDAACLYPMLDAVRVLVIDNENLDYHYRLVADSMSRKFEVDYFKRAEILLDYLTYSLAEGKDLFQDYGRQLIYYKIFLIETGLNQAFAEGQSMNGLQKIRRLRQSMERTTKAFFHIDELATLDLPRTLVRRLSYLAGGHLRLLAIDMRLGQIRSKQGGH